MKTNSKEIKNTCKTCKFHTEMAGYGQCRSNKISKKYSQSDKYYFTYKYFNGWPRIYDQDTCEKYSVKRFLK